jgi:hypothetical protein
MLHRVALVRTEVSEELSASIIRVTRIAELRTSGELHGEKSLEGSSFYNSYSEEEK